jgi:hypothetical protein
MLARRKIGGDLWGNRFFDCGVRRGIQCAHKKGRIAAACNGDFGLNLTANQISLLFIPLGHAFFEGFLA